MAAGFPSQQHAAARVVQALAAYPLIAACLTLVGWAFNIPRLAAWDGNIAQMPNNALTVITASAGLICWSLAKRRAAIACGAIAAAIAGATLFEHLTGLDLGIDTLVLYREWGQTGTMSPGRMGLPASVALAVIGATLVLRNFPRAERFVTAGGLFTVGISMLSLIGNLFGADRLYAIPRTTAIAFQSSTMLFVLGAGLVASLPDRAPMKTFLGDSAASLLVRRAALGIVVLPTLVGWLTLYGQRAGLFDPAFGTAALVLMLIGLLAALLWWSASAIATHEQALRESKEKFSLLFEKAAFGAALARLQDGVIVDVNEAFEKMFGLTRAGVIGRTSAELDIALFERGSVRDREIRRDSKSGEARTFVANVTIIDLRNEKHLLATVQDITAQKMVEEALRATDRVKDEFLANLSHEMRTPLTSIIGWSEIVLREKLDSGEVRMGLEAIRAGAKAQAQLIEDLLDVSRIISGKVRLRLEPVDLAEVIDDAVATVRPAAEAKGIPIELSLDRSLPRHLVDRDRIQQVVWNLLSNAIKFSSRGAAIEVALHAGNDATVIAVTDHGRGIARDFLPHIFERFRQADSSTRRSETGLGIGLSLAKDLVELHGGTIGAETEEGRGSRFTVELPAATASPSAAPDVSSPAPAAQLGGLRVLYVDDREDARTLIGRMLREHGAEVLQARSADEAMLLLERENADVIVTDLAMPDRDGYDLLAMIRAAGRWPDLPVLALTAHAAHGEDHRAAEAGFHAFLRKPIDSHDLVAAVARASRNS